MAVDKLNGWAEECTRGSCVKQGPERTNVRFGLRADAAAMHSTGPLLVGAAESGPQCATDGFDARFR